MKIENEITSNDGQVESFSISFESQDIFKYDTLKHLEKILTNNSLYFNSTDKYNDPFEMAFDSHTVFRSSLSENITSKLETKIANKADQIYDILKNKRTKFISQYKACCFSMIATEPLMWSHYASDHKGICCCFNKNNLFKVNNNYSLENQMHSGKIIYSNKLPEIQCIDYLLTEESITLELIKILLTKSINWAYEKEYRYFIKSTSNIFNINPQSLQAIFIGLRVEKSESEKISTLVNQYNAQHKTNVRIAYARKSPKNYEMEIASNNSTMTNRRYSWI